MLLRILGLLTSLALAAAIFTVVWGKQAFGVGLDADTAMWYICWLAVGLFAYLLIQSFAAHSPPNHFDMWWALDIVFSVLPLFTALTAVVANRYFDLTLDTFQKVFVILTATTAFIDLIMIYTLVKERRRPQPDVHPLRDRARTR